jgi:hypothetical protein
VGILKTTANFADRRQRPGKSHLNLKSIFFSGNYRSLWVGLGKRAKLQVIPATLRIEDSSQLCCGESSIDHFTERVFKSAGDYLLVVGYRNQLRLIVRIGLVSSHRSSLYLL